ncbi:hypothetical protein [Mesorhizobium sp. M0800]|uniref:hypothetical protein n=1 Tax=Mesorhizobium sp. M0800 TaxID=2957000 RepID=UPI00333A6E82
MQTVRKSRLIMQLARALATSVKMTAVVSVAVPHTINVAYVLAMPAFAFAQDKCYDAAKDQADPN